MIGATCRMMGLALVLLALSWNHATAGAPSPERYFQGTWLGIEEVSGQPAVFMVRGNRVVLYDPLGVTFGQVTALHAKGLNTKSGTQRFEIDLKVTGMTNHEGLPIGPAFIGQTSRGTCELRRPAKGPASFRLCAANPGQKTRPMLPPGPARRVSPYACWEVSAVTSSVRAGDCVAACQRQNQMRAVSADIIAADCRRSCASPPPKAPTAPTVISSPPPKKTVPVRVSQPPAPKVPKAPQATKPSKAESPKRCEQACLERYRMRGMEARYIISECRQECAKTVKPLKKGKSR